MDYSNRASIPTGLAVFIIVITATPLVTLLVTSLRFNLSKSDRRRGRRAPLVPHAIPVVGHALQFVISLPNLIQQNLYRCSDYRPLRFHGLGVEMSFISGTENLLALFRQSRILTPGATANFAVEHLFGTPKHLIASLYGFDNTGLDYKPTPGSRNVEPHLRVHHIVYVQAHKYLIGSASKPLSQRLMTAIAGVMHDGGIGDDWLDLNDFFDFCRTKLLRASLDAMFGRQLVGLHPNFVEDFWAFDHCTLTLAKGLPRWMTPCSNRARRRCLESLKSWKVHIDGLAGADGEAKYDEFDPFFESEIIRQRHKAFDRMRPMNADAIASEDLAMVWAANSNAIPATYWFLYEIYRDPCLLERARSEVTASGFLAGSEIATSDTNLNNLVNMPLLQSVYTETLRLRTAILVVRTPERENARLGEYLFRPGELIMAASYVAHRDVNVWNQGTGEDPHTLDEFWADRFLKPVHDINLNCHEQGLHDQEDVKKRTQETSYQPTVKFSTEGLSKAWIPYGGGQGLCPGRQLAKQMIFMTFAILATDFDIEILHQPGEEAKPDMRYWGLGTLPPKNKTPFRIRKRVRCDI